jgi:hypothetical protein
LTWAFTRPLVFVEEAAENRPALDLLPGEVGDRVIGPGRAEFAAAMGASSVVVGLVLGHHGAQVSMVMSAVSKLASLLGVVGGNTTDLREPADRCAERGHAGS